MPVSAPRLLAGAIAVCFVSSLAPVASARFSGPQVKLAPIGGSPQQGFGASVDVATGLIIAGAPNDNPAGNFSGSAYLLDAATGGQLFRFTASNGQKQDRFGAAVSVYADHAIVGAPNANAVYVYDTATGDELRILTPSGGTAPVGFGQSLDLFGDIAIIASTPDDNFNGAVYLFDVSTGDQLARITAPVAGGQFGRDVAIYGDRAVVGAPNANEAYIYDVNSAALLHTLTTVGTSKFGDSVAIDETSVLVGAPNTDIDATTRGQVTEFNLAGSEVGSFAQTGFGRFGKTVAISPQFRFIGAGIFGDSSPVNNLIVYETSGPFPPPITILVGEDPTANFASACAADKQFLVVGDSSISAGAIYLLRIDDGVTDPNTQIVDEGDTATFSIEAPDALAFQWRRDGVDLIDGGDVSGATTDTLQIANADGADIGIYDCVVTFADGPQTTNGAVLAVVPGVPDCLGDTNGDGVVDLADLNAVLAAFGQACP
ncbi:MAG: hypothetical protein NXI14_15115 [bacterium]|nr:hypothetical protein [bacterium]